MVLLIFYFTDLTLVCREDFDWSLREFRKNKMKPRSNAAAEHSNGSLEFCGYVVFISLPSGLLWTEFPLGCSGIIKIFCCFLLVVIQSFTVTCGRTSFEKVETFVWISVKSEFSFRNTLYCMRNMFCPKQFLGKFYHWTYRSWPSICHVISPHRQSCNRLSSASFLTLIFAVFFHLTVYKQSGRRFLPWEVITYLCVSPLPENGSAGNGRWWAQRLPGSWRICGKHFLFPIISLYISYTSCCRTLLFVWLNLPCFGEIYIELCGPVLYISPGKCDNLEKSKERKIKNNQRERGAGCFLK